jgi:transposase
MANVLKVHEQSNIQQLAARGWSRRRIARTLKLDRKTVRRYLRAAAKSPTISTPGPTDQVSKSPGISTPGDSTGAQVVTEAVNAQAGRPSLCEPHRQRIQSKLDSGLSAQRIFQDLAEEVGFSGSYQSVKRFARELRAEQPERVWRIEVAPAEEVQIDFGAGAWVTDSQGRRRRPWVLRVVLSFSRKAYSEAVFHQTTESLIRSLENAFRAFGGVPQTVNLDNLRAAVHQADWCDPQLSPKLESFCRHYGCALIPCLPRTPEHKGKVENSVKYVKTNALRGRTFSSLSAHNEFLRHWEKTVADMRIHGTTRQQVCALFAQEQSALLPLPPDLFPCFKEGLRSVHRDSYVEVDKAYYSVPPEYIGQDVWVRWDGHEVRIFNPRWEQIKLHRHLEPGQFDTVLGLGGGRGPLQQQLNYWLGRADELGQPCGQWCRQVVEQKGPLGLRSVMGLMGLTREHSFKRINEACASAASRGAWRLRDIKALLEQRQREVQTHLAFAQEHPLIRNLAEYGLFIQNKTQ